MRAVITREERPLMEPQVSPTGISYQNAWKVAAACWPTPPQGRIRMAEALRRLRADPSLAIGLPSPLWGSYLISGPDGL